jgi:dTDP-4-amino-4,6-dideoxygalactose transaminase
MTAKMIPLAEPDVSGNEAAYLQECIRSTFVSSVGPFVQRFEAMLAESTGAVDAVTTCSGTSALHLALTTVGVGRDDLVILPSLTFIASANAISHCGASPLLVDVSEESWSLDVSALANFLDAESGVERGRLIHTRSGRRIAAIMPVHTIGAPADMDPLCALAARYALPVVADGAAALGASYKGRPLAQMGAALTAISFNGNKTVTCGGGGAIVGREAASLQRARHLGTTARIGSDYDHDDVGFNYRMTNIEAAVGCAQMERLDSFVAAKRRIRARYDSAFSGNEALSGFPACPWGESACWFSGAVLAPALAGKAQHIRSKLRDRGIDARAFWKPMHLQKPYASAPRADLTVSESLWQRILTLPSSVALSDADLDRVVSETLDVVSHERAR